MLFSWRPSSNNERAELGFFFVFRTYEFRVLPSRLRTNSLLSFVDKNVYHVFDLPESVAQTVAINAENSTVMAPLSLYAITCVKIITPIANRL